MGISRTKIGWFFFYALFCMNVFAQDGTNKERLPNELIEKIWNQYKEVMSNGGNRFICRHFRDTISIDEMVERIDQDIINNSTSIENKKIQGFRPFFKS